jgi:hypothetical protein
MDINLGIPQVRGKTDAVDNYESETNIEPGLAVKRTAEDKVALFDGSGTPTGVSGYVEVKGAKRLAVVEKGKSVGVILADPTETIAVGAQVYITSDGKFTADDDGNTPTAAIFVSEKGDGLNVLTGEKTAGNAIKIDIIGGF